MRAQASPLSGGGGSYRQRTGRAMPEVCSQHLVNMQSGLVPRDAPLPAPIAPTCPDIATTCVTSRLPHLCDSHAAHGCRPGRLPHCAARASATVGASSGLLLQVEAPCTCRLAESRQLSEMVQGAPRQEGWCAYGSRHARVAADMSARCTRVQL